MTKNEKIVLFVAGIIFALGLAGLLKLNLIDVAQAIQVIITFVLVLVTVAYVKRTSDIAKATREQAQATAKQADASIKMAEEMREQTIMASRPVVIQKAMPVIVNEVAQDFLSHFEIYNAGNGPAVELGISLLNKENSQLSAYSETFLKAGQSSNLGNYWRRVIPFDLANLDASNYCIVCEYQSIFSRGSKKQTWYQTWLPFETTKSRDGKIFVKPGQLEFKEVSEAGRIDAFGSGSKPK